MRFGTRTYPTLRERTYGAPTGILRADSCHMRTLDESAMACYRHCERRPLRPFLESRTVATITTYEPAMTAIGDADGASAADWENLARTLAREIESARVYLAAQAAYDECASRTTHASDAASMADWAADARSCAVGVKVLLDSADMLHDVAAGGSGKTHVEARR